ncbi:MAG: hypothetical protein Q4C85_08725 [Actinomyces sp.]|uniref:hypothetical protein n=1 Tax=Actinomyces sp. TaxID=29317 RepID=UPI0026DD5D57|nr:hypothetical protein [Actinomyces sp.]MDO4243822.1 hypothetical protein [Actinomyces sp.]
MTATTTAYEHEAVSEDIGWSVLVLRQAIRHYDLRAFFYGRRFTQTGDASYEALQAEAADTADHYRVTLAGIIRERGPWAPVLI